MTNQTIRLARQYGCGIILTNGEDRFMVSDWSNGTDDVFGFIEANGKFSGSSYQKLPTDLTLDPE